ncbi:hypothetical protein K501DRAFT_332508 [Backusella circina FSU 941]|nr:hypothetical protein K501DRAFT_332508 [Backusella circina FSU 941]
MTENRRVDIIISGAGPVGLLLAYDLSKKGHSVAIVDTKPGPTDQSRALLITARTMDILDAKGLASDVLREAFISSGMRMLKNGSVFGQLDSCGDTVFPYLVILMQGKTEEIICKHMEAETECRVQWETKLESYTQDDDGVTAIISNKDGNQVIKANYIVGCDGSHSIVRKSTEGWTYEGVAIRTKFLLADLSLHGEGIEEFSHRMNAFNNGSQVLGMARIRPMVHNDDDAHVFRIVSNIESYTKDEGADQKNPSHGIINAADEEAPDLETIQAILDKMIAPFKFEASNVIWSTYFRINERIANGYRRKRAFIAGDAAHCHSPAGGQGMNLGIQDADNLSWKLSAVLKGQVNNPEELLDSYNTERIPQAQAIIKTTSIGTQTAVTDSALMNFVRQCILSIGFSFPQIREYVFKTVTQQSLCINPLHSKILGTSDKGLISTGTFLPDTVPLRKRFIPAGESIIERRTLRSFLTSIHRFIVILVNTSYSTNLPNEGTVKSFYEYTSKHFPSIKRIVIQSPWHTHTTARLDYVKKEDGIENEFYIEERIEDPISVTSRVGLLSLLSKNSSRSKQPSVLLLVRPDFYVAHARTINEQGDLDSAFEYLNTFFSQG